MNDQQHKSVGLSLHEVFESVAVGIGTGSMILAVATQSSKPVTTAAVAFCVAYFLKD